MSSSNPGSHEGEPSDVLIVGGGVTGCGLALDLALRGLSARLIERDDFACATSSASSRLIHGGLRYLEQYRFGFVREALRERALLLANAPDHVRPEPFLFALRDQDRLPRWKLAAGLTLYGALAMPHPLEWPRLAARREIGSVFGTTDGVLPRGIRGGGFYTDGATHDAKLTLAVVAAANRAGADFLRRVEVTRLERSGEHVRVHARDGFEAKEIVLEARCVVAAAGPFTDELRRACGSYSDLLSVTRGTHIVVPASRLPLSRSVIFTSCVDGRVVFFLRWGRYTAIGTTDVDADPRSPVVATRDEVEYLIRSANGLLPDLGLSTDDVLSTVAGLRPLLKQGDRSASARSREEIVLQDGPVFTIGGGKLTGYRAIAEKVGAKVARFLGKGDAREESPTRTSRLPPSDPRFASLEAALRDDDADSIREIVESLRAQDTRLSPADLVLRRTDVGLDAPTVVERARARLEDAMRDLPPAVLADSRAQIASRQAFRRNAPGLGTV